MSFEPGSVGRQKGEDKTKKGGFLETVPACAEVPRQGRGEQGRGERKLFLKNLSFCPIFQNIPARHKDGSPSQNVF